MFDLKVINSVVQQLEEERGIPREKTLEAIAMSLATAYKKEYGKKGQIVRASFDSNSGQVEFWQVKIVVDRSQVIMEGDEEMAHEELKTANVEDINERKNAEATIERLAYYDPLTDLPNRRMMKDRLELAMKRSRRQENGAALLYIDLDSFKHINDSLGHPAGDKLLRVMAKRFMNVLRDDDIVCRMGGDEFAVILHDIHHTGDVVQVARKLLEAVAAPLLLEGSTIVMTGSAGIALFPKDGDDAITLEKHADIALYRAKDEGKNTFRFFSEE